MEQNYTQENLIQFIYRETSITDSFEIANALETDLNLRSTYKGIKSAVSALPRVEFYPSKAVIDNILSYSRKTALETQC